MLAFQVSATVRDPPANHHLQAFPDTATSSMRHTADILAHPRLKMVNCSGSTTTAIKT
jgi:hypothetical protein